MSKRTGQMLRPYTRDLFLGGDRTQRLNETYKIGDRTW
jgi:hypothetical protein